MENDVIQKIRQLLRSRKISVTALSKAIGIPQSTLNRQITVESTMTLSTLNAILHYFPDISAEWLLRGKGEMSINGKPQQGATSTRSIGELEIDENGYLKLKIK